jgi:uncharacterized protein YqgV (UPF0045/DUF77 family)
MNPMLSPASTTVENNLDTYREIVQRLKQVKRRAIITRATITTLVLVSLLTMYLLR